ncbi:hypothetical protein F5876DRAFT_70489 [Lentinula aff. lateritia]|uniref:Uncharacterized protein n=1 Tax=Lentinula aff. lateritia TaxID=2804960 RepID=A0ACC1TJ49_9AGAR|nr:hypothetical protein F5876DRAFT_70489 [Lentinula aff. lateritia]
MAEPIEQHIALYYIFAVTFDTTVWYSGYASLKISIIIGRWTQFRSVFSGGALQSPDAFADVVLVVFPLILLRYLQSAQAQVQKIRLGVSFIIGGLTTIVSIVHAVYLLQGTQISILVSNVELSVSVTISNFAVLVAAAHQLWNRYYPSQETTKVSTMAFGSAPQIEQNSQGSSDSEMEDALSNQDSGR